MTQITTDGSEVKVEEDEKRSYEMLWVTDVNSSLFNHGINCHIVI